MKLVENKAGISFQILSAGFVAMAVCWVFTLCKKCDPPPNYSEKLAASIFRVTEFDSVE
jgi:hypothetical protein